MQSIRETLQLAHRALSEAGVDHTLIGDISLGRYGIHRATMDVDLLIPRSMKQRAKAALIARGLVIRAEIQESLHFSGSGNLDLLLANREPIRKMLERAGRATVAWRTPNVSNRKKSSDSKCRPM